jgi:hypothetical protein
MMMKAKICTRIVLLLVAVLVAGATRAVIEAGFVPSAETETVVEDSSFFEAAPTEEHQIGVNQEEEEKSPAEIIYESVTANTSPGYPYLLPGWRGRLRKALDKKIDVNFDKTPFDEALSYVAECIGIRIVVDWADDKESYLVTIKLRQIRAQNVLNLISVGDENQHLSFEIKPDAIHVRKYSCGDGSCPDWQSDTEKVLEAIEQARLAIACQKEYDRLHRAFVSTRPREFDWKGRTVGEAVREIGDAYDLNVVMDPRLDDDLVLRKAPQVSFAGNAPYALETLAAGLGLVYRFCTDGVLITEKDSFLDCSDKERKWEETFEEFTETSLLWAARSTPLNDLLEKVKLETGVNIYPDRATWEADIRVELTGENLTIKDLFDCLYIVHGVEYLFNLDFETGQGTLFLLKSQ